MTSQSDRDTAPAALECQSEIDKDLVRTYYGDREAFDRVRAFLAAPVLSTSQPAGKLACRRCGGWGTIMLGNGDRETCALCHGTTIDPDQSPAILAATPDCYTVDDPWSWDRIRAALAATLEGK